MKNKPSLKQKFKSFFPKEKKLRAPKLIHPHRDWAVGVVSVLIIFVISVLWGTSKYQYYKELSVSNQSNSQGEVVVYKDVVVNAALSIEEEKAKTYNQIINKFATTKPEVDVASSTESSEITDTNETGTTTEEVVE